MIELIVSVLLFLALIVVVAGVSVFGDKWLAIARERLNVEMRNWERYADRDYVELIKKFVMAAEQIYPASSNQEKLEYVLRLVKTRYPNIDIETARAFVEAAVVLVKNKDLSSSSTETVD